MYLNRLIDLPKKSSFFLLGPRQVGKSTLIKHKFAKQSWSINLLIEEDYLQYSSNPQLFIKEAVTKIKKEKIKTIFIDEIQRLPSLLNEVQFLMQEYPDCQFILSGSSARKLKRGGANLLGGRAVERFLFPMTYMETKDDFDLEQALTFGTLPPILAMDKEEKIDTLSTYVNTYLREEIQAEGIVRNLGAFSKFLNVAASQCGDLLNFAAIARECQLPSSTIQSYYQILEDTLIGFKLEPWRKSVRHRLSAQSKFYFFDTGVINAINKSLTAKLIQPLRGRLFEHFIILETYRNIKYKRSEANLFFWRTSNHAEVDLLIEKHGQLIAAIEIKSTSSLASRDLSGLMSFNKTHPDVPCYVVSNVKNSYELSGVTILNWQNYLTDILPEII